MATTSNNTGSRPCHSADLALRAAMLQTAGESIACLAELVSSHVSGLRNAVREQGAGAADLGDWHEAELLLNLAIEQAAIVTAATA